MRERGDHGPCDASFAAIDASILLPFRVRIWSKIGGP
jgi:hypothetical protein